MQPLVKCEAQAIQNQNRKAEENCKRGEKLFEDEKYEKACKEFQAAFDNCSDGYKSQRKFKESISEAFSKRAIQLFKEADDLGRENQFEKAMEKFKEAEKLSKDSEEKRLCLDKQSLMLKHIGDQLRSNGSLEQAMKNYEEALNLSHTTDTENMIVNSFALLYAKEGEKFFHEGNYKEAEIKFKQAFDKTGNSHDKDHFNFWLERIRTEVAVSEIKNKADMLFNTQKYTEAINEYRLASQKTGIDNEKTKLTKTIEEIEKILKDLQLIQKQGDQLKKDKTFELVNDGFQLICQGNLLADEQSERAIQKYDDAGKLFEIAGKIQPTNIIFNSFLKLINGYYQIQAYDQINNLISVVKTIFSGKSSELDQIKEKVKFNDWTIDYMSRVMMEENERDENVRRVGNF